MASNNTDPKTMKGPKMKIYLASSWRNNEQPSLVVALRDLGHEVYDFRNPPQRSGFAWKQICDDELNTPQSYMEHINHPDANAGFDADFSAMQWADCIVCLLPCGRSAHWEVGWGAGAGKKTYIVLSTEKFEPELMYKGATQTFEGMQDFLAFLQTV